MRERKNIIKLYSYYHRYKGYKKIASCKRIARRLLLSQNCVLKYVDIHIQTNSLSTFYEKCGITHGRPREYTNNHLRILKGLIVINSTLYLEEIQYELMKRVRKYFTISMIVRMLDKLNMTRKRINKIGYHFKLRNVRLFQLNLRLRGIRKSQLVFADESYHHDRIANRNYGRSIRYCLSVRTK